MDERALPHCTWAEVRRFVTDPMANSRREQQAVRTQAVAGGGGGGGEGGVKLTF